MKNQKGITLVALVVTIVVLLILAGVTIMYVLSDDGVFSSATKASDNTNEAYVEEVVATAILQTQSNYYSAKYDDDTTTTPYATIDEATAAAQKIMRAAGITADSFTFTSFCDVGSSTTTVASGSVSYKSVTYAVSYDTATGALTLTAQ